MTNVVNIIILVRVVDFVIVDNEKRIDSRGILGSNRKKKVTIGAEFAYTCGVHRWKGAQPSLKKIAAGASISAICMLMDRLGVSSKKASMSEYAVSRY